MGTLRLLGLGLRRLLILLLRLRRLLVLLLLRLRVLLLLRLLVLLLLLLLVLRLLRLLLGVARLLRMWGVSVARWLPVAHGRKLSRGRDRVGAPARARGTKRAWRPASDPF